jgi:hypothetical protein
MNETWHVAFAGGRTAMRARECVLVLNTALLPVWPPTRMRCPVTGNAVQSWVWRDCWVGGYDECLELTARVFVGWNMWPLDTPV